MRTWGRRLLVVAAVAALSVVGVTVTAVSPAAAAGTSGSIRSVGITRSASSVQPVVDGYLDTVQFGIRARSSTGGRIAATGSIRVTRGTTTVRSWTLTSSAARTVSWDGRVKGVIEPGTYTVRVTLRGSRGVTRGATTTVTVSSAHLPYRADRLFSVDASLNQQGLAYDAARSRFYVTYAVGTDAVGTDGRFAKIGTYTASGRLIAMSGPLPLGHAAEASVRAADGLLYVANGGMKSTPGDTATHVYAVDMSTPATPVVERSYDLEGLGINGMVAVDDQSDRMLVFAGPDGGPYTASWVDFASAAVTPAFTIPLSETPQGIEFVGGDVWYYTSSGDIDRMTVYTTGGTQVARFRLGITGEAEGLAVDEATGRVFVGVHSPNRVLALTPLP